jgi:hypothetical protein
MDRPPLPLEVQQRIVRFALPLPSRYTYTQRNHLLTSLSLVSKSWRRRAQSELLSFVVISEPKRCFTNRLRAGPSTTTPEGLDKGGVKRLLVKRRGPQGTAKAGTELFELCKKVEEVWLESSKSYQEDNILLFKTIAELKSESLSLCSAPRNQPTELTLFFAHRRPNSSPPAPLHRHT